MKIRSILSLSLSLLLLAGCARENAATPDASTSSADSAVGRTPSVDYLDTANQAYRDSSHLPKSGGVVRIVEDIERSDLKKDMASIPEAYATGDGVQLKVDHSGGCKAHTLLLYAERKLERGEPAIGHLYLSHDAGGDNCEALLTVDLTYDLTPLVASYRDVEKYSGPVRLMIHEPGKREAAQSVMVEVK